MSKPCTFDSLFIILTCVFVSTFIITLQESNFYSNFLFQYGLPLKVVSYKDLYGWTMDEIVKMIGLKNNCTFCGVFRRQVQDFIFLVQFEYK